MKTVWLKGLLCCSLVLCMSAALHAQRGPGGGGGGGPRPGMPPGGGGGNPGFGGGDRGGFPSNRRAEMPPPPNSAPRDNNGNAHGGTQLGPSGRWWDDKGFSKTVGLRKEQQKKMDQIFNANKSAILENYKSLQREESKLAELTKQSQPDRAKLFAQIDAVNQARSALEKSRAQMLLQIRQEMEPDQINRMDSLPPEDAQN